MMYNCQQRCDPGLACSRNVFNVRRTVHHSNLLPLNSLRASPCVEELANHVARQRNRDEVPALNLGVMAAHKVKRDDAVRGHVTNRDKIWRRSRLGLNLNETLR